MPSPEPHRFTALGYKVVELISNTGRNACYKVEKDGQTYFAKQSLTKQPMALENDVWWCLTVARLGKAGDKPIIAPTIYEHGLGWYVAEYFDAPLLVQKSWRTGAEVVPQIARLVDILTWLDRQVIFPEADALYDSSESAPYTDLLKKVDGWLEAPLAQGTVKSGEVSQAKMLVEKYRPHIKPALQHGDFVPWHLFDLGQKLCLFDGEHASLAKPRYYDLAYLYTRLYTRGEAPDAARAILRKFMQAAQVDQKTFEQAFLPVVTLRAMGMQADALADRGRFDYTTATRSLLQACLKEDLAALLA